MEPSAQGEPRFAAVGQAGAPALSPDFPRNEESPLGIPALSSVFAQTLDTSPTGPARFPRVYRAGADRWNTSPAELCRVSFPGATSLPTGSQEPDRTRRLRLPLPIVGTRTLAALCTPLTNSPQWCQWPLVHNEHKVRRPSRPEVCWTGFLRQSTRCASCRASANPQRRGRPGSALGQGQSTGPGAWTWADSHGTAFATARIGQWYGRVNCQASRAGGCQVGQFP